jgi:hypothetical protein
VQGQETGQNGKQQHNAANITSVLSVTITTQQVGVTTTPVLSPSIPPPALQHCPITKDVVHI